MPVDVQKRRPLPTRDALTTVADDGSRVFLHPADVRGRFTRWRRLVGVLLMAVYAALPWIPVGGHPAVFLDVSRLRFHFFGFTLAAQDLWLGFFLLTGLGFSLFLVTAVAGRLWCGWACPQTVFLDHVYRRIERWLEGDAARRRLLDRAPWTTEKWLRRGTKHLLFVLVSLVITHVFLAYFVSLPRVFTMVTHSPLEHWGVFVSIVVGTGVLYGNFAWFREQLCIIICPYGRLQSALMDDDSLTIGYDAGRGEPRGRLQRIDERGQRTESGGDRPADTPSSSARGDCIDCNRCVQVCPTGIDIRQGLQMECIGCAACIDACDAIMDRVGHARGLIRYDSLNGLGRRPRRLWRPRIVLYLVLLLLGAGVATVGFRNYEPATLGITRMQGAPYFVDAASVRNQFFVRLINKGAETQSFRLTTTVDGEAPQGWRVTGWEEAVEVASGGEEVRPLIILVPRENYAGRFTLRVVVESTGGDARIERVAEFIGPDPRLFRAHEAGAR